MKQGGVMASKIDICNDALLYLGENTINSLDPNGTKAEQLCYRFFDKCFAEVLRDADWTFASDRALVAQLTATPLFGWSYQYQLPGDCLFLREVYGGYDYRIEQRKLLMNIDGDIYVRYTKQVTDFTLLDQKFMTALAYWIAAKIAYSLTGKMELQQAMIQYYAMEMQVSQDLDGAEETENPIGVQWQNVGRS